MKNTIEAIVNQWDPIGLFPGAPKDEYEVEIDSITRLVDRSPNVEHLAEGIKKIFTHQFGDDVFTRNYSECFDVAKKIWKYNKSK